MPALDHPSVRPTRAARLAVVRADRRARTRSRWVRGTAIAVAAVLVLALSIVVARSATPQIELLVDSLAQTADTSPGDGTCATGAGECTLRAAIEESNALAADPGEVRIGVAPEFAGGRIDLVTTTSTWMRGTSVSTGGSVLGDFGAIFEVTAPVTIDLEHRLTAAPVPSLDGPAAALFYLNGPDIHLTGVDQSYTGETTFYVGPAAARVTIADGTIRTPNYYPERFLVVRGGAGDVTVSGYTISGYASSENDWGWGFVDGSSASAPVGSVTIEGTTYEAQTSGACNGSDASGCSSTPLQLRNQTVREVRLVDSTVRNLNVAQDNNNRLLDLRSATVDRLTVTGSTFTAPRIYSGEPLIDLGASGAAATVGDLTITDNVATGVVGASDENIGLIRLPAGRGISGTGVISGNDLRAAGSGTPAIYWQGPQGSAVDVTASHLTIEDNHFDGWASTAGDRSTIRLYQTGAVTVQRNTFGTASGSQARTVAEEGTASGSYATTMVNNWSLSANGKLNTWFPTARTSADVQTTALTARRCTIPLEVAPPQDDANTTDLTAARYPVTPVTLDVYWTAGTTAEVFLEQVTLDTAVRTTLDVALPLAGDPRLAHLPEGATLPVDPTTGAVTGGLRVQTHDVGAGATAASSQLSRVATIDGTCQPVLTIDQDAEQNDPTLARDLHYTVTSSVPLDPSTFTAEDVTLDAAPTAETVDADRLHPRVVSVTEVAGAEGERFDVVVRVDDSATVTAGVPADAVRSTVGLANTAPASSTDATITFVNPLLVQPPRFTVVTGDPVGADYAIVVRPGAPAPSAELTFTATVDATGTAHGVRLSTSDPVIAAGAERTDPVTVTADAGDVPAGTAVVIAHTVTSADPGYDGLVVPPARPSLFATDPAIQIRKRAYVGVTDASTPERVEATGTEVLTGSRLLDGEPVCWVYTVSNTSADDWTTTLTDVVVTDSDTRLGVGGTIGTIPSLAVGESARLSACAVLLPQGGGAS
jgi:adhesin/invasin